MQSYCCLVCKCYLRLFSYNLHINIGYFYRIKTTQYLRVNRGKGSKDFEFTEFL